MVAQPSSAVRRSWELEAERAAAVTLPMLHCPECKRSGVPGHSVLLPLRAAERAVSLAEVEVYARCRLCRAVFQLQDPAWVPIDPRGFEALQPVGWIVPPWVVPSVAADFELSWDVVEDFFVGVAIDYEPARIMIPMVAAFRLLGYGVRLRAGQSLYRLVLSRSREHGLRGDQSYLQIAPLAEGVLEITGQLNGRRIHRDRVPPTIEGWLVEQVDALAREALD